MFAIPIHDEYAWLRKAKSDRRLSRDDKAVNLEIFTRTSHGRADIPSQFSPSLEDLRLVQRLAEGTYGKRIMTRPSAVEAAGYLHITRRTGKGNRHLYRLTVPVDVALELTAQWHDQGELGKAVTAFPDLAKLAGAAAWEAFIATTPPAGAEDAGPDVWLTMIESTNAAHAASEPAAQSRTPASGYQAQSRTPASEYASGESRTPASGYQGQSRTLESAKQDATVLHPTQPSQKDPSSWGGGWRDAQAQTNEDDRLLAKEVLAEVRRRIGSDQFDRLKKDIAKPGVIGNVDALYAKIAAHHRAGHFDGLVAALARPQFPGAETYGPRLRAPARALSAKLNEFSQANPLPPDLAATR